MKTLDEIIKERRSIRKYSDKPVETEKIQQALEAARLAPSACNEQPWRFVAVSEKSLRDSLIENGLGVIVPNKWARSAPAVIVVCSELKLFTHKIAEQVQGVHYHLIDIGIACEHLVLKAAELGLGTCYIGWFNAKGVSKVLGLPSSWKVECLITLGYPADTPDASPRKPLDKISFINPDKNSFK
ncbi:MAG TPA: NAD(P)H nitroreductase [Elusimicrobia bacterium]|nr:MAG: hypothetical protein A2278_04840 [Elusimicrobia bacterium RIFOXYA12_FULL_49_49]OGS06259.1 MAG: hypothetical protein A2204_06205 [Elusimicrobia bacterium RIFOXYA1_FULL_47_7]OGS14627.1 MAG: hypothetical protein A2251_09000 [Elusimicrobia bacterium RIFOXYA2_FULL_47_53]OGS25720.1 MAG: hypothetical protein A2339_06590 [Elusimicrobia bacterium RIFOXYB12_FULL_50_12]OGS31718.1 MAG: hypothetical protein A2323_05910 [Elusimicrobia bacterium RIFOXYB2_FULL_46_23]HBU69755.1 NAD(P)H nitroreductase [